MTPVITTDCRGCGACLLTCPEHAIRPHGEPLVVVGSSRTRVQAGRMVTPRDYRWAES